MRILTAALDERLGTNAYIILGLGDFGDLIMEGVTIAQLTDWFVRPRIMTVEEADIVMARTAAIAAK